MSPRQVQNGGYYSADLVGQKKNVVLSGQGSAAGSGQQSLSLIGWRNENVSTFLISFMISSILSLLFSI